MKSASMNWLSPQSVSRSARGAKFGTARYCCNIFGRTIIQLENIILINIVKQNRVKYEGFSQSITPQNRRSRYIIIRIENMTQDSEFTCEKRPWNEYGGRFFHETCPLQWVFPECTMGFERNAPRRSDMRLWVSEYLVTV